MVDAGDDVADLGTKAFSRDQEFALALSIRARMDQVERAMERLDEGTDGRCERCSEDIPVARLTAFPSVTLCVALQEPQRAPIAAQRAPLALNRSTTPNARWAALCRRGR